MKLRTILSWSVFVIAAALVVYGSVHSVEIIKAVPRKNIYGEEVYQVVRQEVERTNADGEQVTVKVPKLEEMSEFEAIKNFGGTGITHQSNTYPQRNKYTGVCFA